MSKRYFLLCQEHGWFDTTVYLESAEEQRDIHRMAQHPDRDGRPWDGEIIITKEISS